MRDTYFERTLVLLCQHDEKGAMGVVINREHSTTIDEVIETLSEEHPTVRPGGKTDLLTWWGGPVDQTTGFVLWPGTVNDDEGWNVAENVAVSPSLERLVELLEKDAHFRICLGYAGWGAGQLEDEIRCGAWLVVDVNAKVVFDTPLEDRYDMALASLGLSAHTIWMQPIDE